MIRSRLLSVAAAAGTFALLAVDPLQACSVCFGDPSSAQTRGLRSAILFLLLLVGLVQVGFLRLFWRFRQRARSLDERKRKFSIVRGGVRP
jgi:hypothetical protein